MSATLTIIDLTDIMHKTQLPLQHYNFSQHKGGVLYIQAIECTQLLHSILNYFVLRIKTHDRES